MATDKTRYKDVKVRIPEEELAVLNCRVAKTGMSREQYIRCLIADTIPAEFNQLYAAIRTGRIDPHRSA